MSLIKRRDVWHRTCATCNHSKPDFDREGIICELDGELLGTFGTSDEGSTVCDHWVNPTVEAKIKAQSEGKE